MRPALIVSLLWLAGAGALAQPTPASRTPNVVLIMTDDLGYGDLGSYGAPDISTPHIDRLARDGVRFTDFYANGPQCTPTRAGLISGRYQQRLSLERAISVVGPTAETGLTATGRSLPQLLKDNGYRTALVGKWHLGFDPAFSPNAHGFDEFFGFKSGYIDYYVHARSDGRPDLFENGTPITRAGYMTDLITDRAVGFISNHASRRFFLDVSYSAPHWPYQVPDHPSVAARNSAFQGPADAGPATRADYAAMVARVDQGVGAIVAALESRGLARNTLVIFTNDNGGEWLSRNAPFFHRKDTLWEGGIRVPAILKWPGRLPAGHTTSQVGVTMDLTASILAATGTPAPPGAPLEGIDLLPLVVPGARTIERTLFWRIAVPTRQQRAVRRGNWKLLLDDDDLLLFDLTNDLGERHDVARSRPEMVNDLLARLSTWERDVDAEAQRRPPAAR